jgi:hypothetical protein
VNKGKKAQPRGFLVTLIEAGLVYAATFEAQEWAIRIYWLWLVCLAIMGFGIFLAMIALHTDTGRKQRAKLRDVIQGRSKLLFRIGIAIDAAQIAALAAFGFMWTAGIFMTLQICTHFNWMMIKSVVMETEEEAV